MSIPSQKHVFVVIIRGPNSHIVLRLRDFTCATNRRFTTYEAAVRYLRAYITKNKSKWDALDSLHDDKLLRM